MNRASFTLTLLLTCSSLVSSACAPKRTSPIEKAEFGILFGGQVQERSEIPFELDTTRQALGFVITLREPLTSPTTLHWEVSKPGPYARLSDPLDRRVELFDAPLTEGQMHITKPVLFEPGDSLGLWNLRVVLGNHLAIDRSFMVYDPGSRRRKVREPVVVVDAGL